MRVSRSPLPQLAFMLLVPIVKNSAVRVGVRLNRHTHFHQFYTVLVHHYHAMFNIPLSLGFHHNQQAVIVPGNRAPIPDGIRFSPSLTSLPA